MKDSEDMQNKRTKEASAELLRKTAERLSAEGIGRYPCRSDFSEEDVAAIKSFFGPWPRALEAAGVKPPREDDRLAKNREKRIRAARRRNEAKNAAKNAAKKAAKRNGLKEDTGNGDLPQT